jgi:hypothetical protein
MYQPTMEIVFGVQSCAKFTTRFVETSSIPATFQACIAVRFGHSKGSLLWMNVCMRDLEVSASEILCPKYFNNMTDEYFPCLKSVLTFASTCICVAVNRKRCPAYSLSLKVITTSF